MKKLLFLLIICFSANLCFSQEKTGIYFIDGDNDINVPTSRIAGKKVGNIVGASLTLGLSAANNNIVIEGKESELKITNEQPSFKFIFGEEGDITGYILSKVSNIDNIVLVKLHQKGKSRHLRTGKYGLTAGVQNGLNEDDIFPISVEKINDSTIIIRPKEKLKKGEYCLYFTGDKPEGVNEFNSIFDFSIK